MIIGMALVAFMMALASGPGTAELRVVDPNKQLPRGATPARSDIAPGPLTKAVMRAARAMPQVILDPDDPSLELEPVTDHDLPDDPAMDIHEETCREHPSRQRLRGLARQRHAVLEVLSDVGLVQLPLQVLVVLGEGVIVPVGRELRV